MVYRKEQKVWCTERSKKYGVLKVAKRLIMVYTIINLFALFRTPMKCDMWIEVNMIFIRIVIIHNVFSCSISV